MCLHFSRAWSQEQQATYGHDEKIWLMGQEKKKKMMVEVLLQFSQLDFWPSENDGAPNKFEFQSDGMIGKKEEEEEEENIGFMAAVI